MERIFAETTTYSVEGDWRIDIVESTDLYEAWLYKKNTGHKMYMFGIPKEQPTGDNMNYEMFVDMIADMWEEYAPDYEEEVDDLETAANERFFSEEEGD